MRHGIRTLLPLVFQFALTARAAAVSVTTEYPIPSPGSRPAGIGSGNGVLWFTEFETGKIGRIDGDGSITEFTPPTPDSGPEGVTASPDVLGRLGFTEFKANKVGRIDPDGTMTEFSVPTPNSGPRGIVVGESHSLWFTEFNANRIGALSLQGGFTEYPIATPSSGPLAITLGPSALSCCSSDIWFTEFAGNKIGRINQQGVMTEYPIPTVDSGPSGIVRVSYGGVDAILFTELNANKIGRITPDGVITEFDIPAANSGPLGISTINQFDVWFTESRANRIARLNADGTITEFPIPTPNSRPSAISGTWFVETDGNRIGRLDSDWLVVVGAGHAGHWDTEFDLANGNGRLVAATVGARGSPACPGFCRNPIVTLDVPSRGVRRVAARDVPFLGERFDTFLVMTALNPDDDLPTTRARIINRDRPSQSTEIPVFRYSTLRRLSPSVLSFPTATRAAGAYCNLVVAEVSAGGGPLDILLEAYSADGVRVGQSRSWSLGVSETAELGDVLGLLGVASLDDGQIRVTKTGGNGLLWGLLATAYDDGRLTVSPGLNP